MNNCVYCDREFENNDEMVFVAGSPMHRECEKIYQLDLQIAEERQHSFENEYEAYHAQFDKE